MQIKRHTIFVILCVLAIATVSAYVRYAHLRTPLAPVTQLPQRPTPSPDGSTQTSISSTVPVQAAVAPTVAARVQDEAKQTAKAEQHRLFFRHNGVDQHYGALAFVMTGRVQERAYLDTLQCEVVHASGGRGICLSADRGVFTTYKASIFDADTGKVIASLPLNGIPSRCRMSVDGRIAALTVFVSGHGYTSLDFSTQTLLIDTTDGKVLADLEDFQVTKDGEPFKSNDFNFWGVTFTHDAKRFYATLSSGGAHYLIRGEIDNRTAVVIRDNVECPSLSPNGRRVAYKKRFIIDGRIVWQLHVLDLASGKDTPLSEKRSIDDQLEWLSDEAVLYSVPSNEGAGASTDIWMAPARGTSPPRLYLPNAYSPAVELKL